MLDRIKALMAAFQLSPSQFADQTTLPRPVVSHILSGRNKPSLEAVQKILAAYPDVAIDWLLNGRGPMLSTPVGPEQPSASPAVAAPPTPAEQPASPAASKRPTAPRPPKPAPAPSAPPEQPWEAPTAPVHAAAAPVPQPAPPPQPLEAPQPVSYSTPPPQGPGAIAAQASSGGLYPAPPAAVQQVVRPEKVVRRIMVFYSDGTFSDHRPLSPEDNPFLW